MHAWEGRAAGNAVGMLETAAWAPLVRKGSGSCTKRQNQALVRVGDAGITAQSCLFKQGQRTLTAAPSQYKQQLGLAGSRALC